ncbi:MAG: fatty acid desaturase [Actinomycetota bacterium]
MLRSFSATFVAAAVVTQIAILTTTVYLHRTLTHRAVALRPGAAAVFRTLTWVTTGIRPRQWVAVHRLHHAHADEEGDPHSPRLLGFGMVQFANAYLYRRAAARPEVVERYARDIKVDRWDRALFDHALVGLGLGIAVLCVVLGPALGLLAALTHAVGYLLLSAAVNAAGHLWGRRPHPNAAGNLAWLAWLAGGEGLHNNHHAVPTAARLSFSRGQVDPGWWVISMLRRAGWATVRLDPAAVSARQRATA